jgi:hypothetical protein
MSRNALRKAETSKMRDFTAKAKDELDSLYASIFTSFTRLSDDERYDRNDMVAVIAQLEDKKVCIQEKFVHEKIEQNLYLEMYSTNSKGKLVFGVGFKSKADIIVYVVWDDIEDRISRLHTYYVKPLQLLAKSHYQKFLFKDPNNQVKVFNKISDSGKKYKAISFEFSPTEIPESYIYDLY